MRKEKLINRMFLRLHIDFLVSVSSLTTTIYEQKLSNFLNMGPCVKNNNNIIVPDSGDSDGLDNLSAQDSKPKQTNLTDGSTIAESASEEEQFRCTFKCLDVEKVMAYCCNHTDSLLS